MSLEPTQQPERPELDFHALSIDTNIILETGYAFDKGLLAQLDQFENSLVQVVFSEIVDREMKRHLVERIREAREALEKGFKKVQQELQVSEATANRARKIILTGIPDEEIARRRLDEFYARCDAAVLPADTAASREVLERYFNQEPPFEAAGDKKLEFPDAYALVSLEKWAEEKNFEVIVVSKDQGWKAFCAASRRLVHRAELGAALKLFQPHNAAERLMRELNEQLLTGGGGADDISSAIAAAIKESVESMEVDVEADSYYYWDACGAYAEYQSHEFHKLTDSLTEIDLVRITEQELTVRLSATIICDAHASFALSMKDPIDKDQVGLGTQEEKVEETFDSDILVTFEGDFPNGLAGVSVKSVEVLEEGLAVDFGEIEIDWGRDDGPEPEDGAADEPGE